MFSDRPNNTRNEKTLALVNEILGKAELVVARENISFNYVKEHLPDVKPVLIPDALFSWYYRPRKPVSKKYYHYN